MPEMHCVDIEVPWLNRGRILRWVFSGSRMFLARALAEEKSALMRR
jgi:hypothetical protein